jgi:serine/threonine protein phosphatase PrpC
MYRGHQAAVAAGVGGVAQGYHPAQLSMDVEFTQLTDVGRVRQGNEDYLGHVIPASDEEVRARGWLFALADGVGGHDLGEVASKTAIESVTAGFRGCTAGEPPAGLLTRLVRNANTRVLDAGHAAVATGVGSMATTIVACALRYDRATVAHVGDSRCYLIRRGQPNLITRDHTLANEQVRLKLLSKEEAAESENRHLLSRSLGSNLMVSVDVNEYQVFADDVLVLCSDGLHGSVSGSEMAALTSHGGDLASAARRLVDIANQRDGSDNISLQLIRVRSVERVGMYRGRPYRLP